MIASAKLRLAALVDPAIDQLTKLLASKIDAVSLGAVKDVLDRAGHKPTDKVEQKTVLAVSDERITRLTPEQLEQAIALGRMLADE